MMRAADRLRPVDAPYNWIWNFKRADSLASLRRLLSKEMAGELRGLNDDAVLKSLEEKLRARKILAYVQWPDHGGAEHSDAPAPAPPPAFPLDQRSTPASGGGPQTDPSLFPDDAALAEIAEAMRRAAESGVPFCEECMKAAIMARQNAQ